jgi:hypothetical protein
MVDRLGTGTLLVCDSVCARRWANTWEDTSQTSLYQACSPCHILDGLHNVGALNIEL